MRVPRTASRCDAAALASIDVDQWRDLADRAVEPNAYNLADWELPLDATARDRTNASALAARAASSADPHAGALIGLIPVVSAHIDGALYHGDSGTLFAERLVAGGARVAVPATLNVGALDLAGLDDDLVQGALEVVRAVVARAHR